MIFFMDFNQQLMKMHVTWNFCYDIKTGFFSSGMLQLDLPFECRKKWTVLYRFWKDNTGQYFGKNLRQKYLVLSF